jgi:hypothetical protein
MAPVVLALAVRAAFPPGGKRARQLLFFVAGASVPLGVVLAYQAACFGSPFVPSYAREAYPAYAALAGRRFFGFGAPDPKVALAYFFHPARGILLFSPFFFWAGPGFARWLRSKRDRADGVFALSALIVSVLALSAYPNWHGGWSFGSRYLLPLLFVTAASLPFALGSSLSRGFFAAAVVFSVGANVLATLSWPNFPLDFSFPPATASAWFLARGWVAPNVGSALGLSPAAALLFPLAAAALALIAALAAARPISPGAPVALILGAIPLAIGLLRPPDLSYPARLLRAAIYGDYSGRDAGRAELARVVEAAATPVERRQAQAAWTSSGPR